MLKSLVIAGALALLAGPVAAEVVERGPDHFVLRYELGLEAAPEDFWTSIGDVSQWWDGAHTYSGDARNMTLPLEVGACFCEALADGTTFEHGRVTAADPQTGILLAAPLGPLKGRTTQADWSIGWSGANRGWNLVMTYVVRGEGVGAWADGVNAVMQGQYSRLVRFIEYGEPAPEAPPGPRS